jgi:rubrerythrin
MGFGNHDGHGEVMIGGSMENKRLHDALEASIGLEQKGYDHYTQALAEAKNPLTKKLFATLAEQELEHMRRIRELFEKEAGKDSCDIIPGTALEMIVKEVFDGFSKDDRSAWDVDVSSAYEHAMHLEQESIDMYSSFAAESANAPEKRFFQELEKEEGKHLTALQNVYHYLTHTADWFESTESETWNWMNT